MSHEESSRITPAELERLSRATVVDSSGDKIGPIEQVYVHDSTGRPSWASIRVGLFRSREALVPLDGVDLNGNEIRVPFAKDVVKDAPRVEVDDHLSRGEEGELHSYYRSHGWTSEVAADTDSTADRPGAAADERGAAERGAAADERGAGADERGAAGTTDGSEVPDTPEPAEPAPPQVPEAPEPPTPPSEPSAPTPSSPEAPEAPETPALVGPADEHAIHAGTTASQATPRSIGIDDDSEGADLPGVHEPIPGGADEGAGTQGDDVVGTEGGGAGTDDQEPDGSSGGRRISAFDEVTDGGYSIGSAAPVGEGVQPMGHSVRAWEDTKTFRAGPEGDWEREPDVWFIDEQAAVNAGFSPSDR